MMCTWWQNGVPPHIFIPQRAGGERGPGNDAILMCCGNLDKCVYIHTTRCLEPNMYIATSMYIHFRWVNQKDPNGKNIFTGGFLGLDNIGEI